MSPALSFSSKHLHSDVEKDKKQKLPKEFEEDKIKREEEKKGILLYIYSSSVYITAVDSHAIVHVCNLLLVNMLWIPEAEKREDSVGGSWQSSLQRTYSQDCSFKDSMYRVGDYVYMEPAEPNLQPHIIYIERLWQDNTGQFLHTKQKINM